MSIRSPHRIPTRIAAAGALLLALQAPAGAQPVDELDWRTAPNALNLELSARTPEDDAARFRWRLDGADGNVICRLDADGDGAFERLILACDARSSVLHRYREGGVFFATMEARAPDGRTGRARVRVDVPGPPPPKPPPGTPPWTGRI
jgi:hypothetical protein